MNRTDWTGAERDTFLQSFSAELTNAAYAVALRHEGRGSWIDLELDLWRALDETVRRTERGVAANRQFAR